MLEVDREMAMTLLGCLSSNHCALHEAKSSAEFIHHEAVATPKQ